MGFTTGHKTNPIHNLKPNDTVYMKTASLLFAICSSLLLAPAASLAQINFATNLTTGAVTSSANSTVTNAQTRKYQKALEGEQLLLPADTKERLKLTDEQKAELKPIEEDFANTSQEYKTANQPRIDAANEANRQARVTKDIAQIQTARAQLQQVWAGLQPYRVAAVAKVRPLLTPDQLAVLDDAKNQWHENHGGAENDPSALEP
jgi:hypothetical protein